MIKTFLLSFCVLACAANLSSELITRPEVDVNEPLFSKTSSLSKLNDRRINTVFNVTLAPTIHEEDHDEEDHDDEDHDEHDDEDHDEHDDEDHDEHDDEDHHDEHDDEDHHDEHDDEEHDEHDDEDHDEHEDHGEPLPWGKTIGFTILVNLATLSGVIFLIPMATKKIRGNGGDNEEDEERVPRKGVTVFIPAFAAGAILATSVFLVLPESLYLINLSLTENGAEDHEDHEDHSGHDHRFLQEDDHAAHEGEIGPDAIWRFGTALLSGVLLPLVFNAIFHRDHEEAPPSEELEKFKDEEELEEDAPQAKKLDISLAASVIIGDALHNFCDGIFIGIGFKLCDDTTAYSIVFVTLYHEIAQEIADYFLLTRNVGLSPFKALSLNFVAGLSVTLGGIVIIATSVSDMVIGILLAHTSGVYLYIATAECLPQVKEAVSSVGDHLLSQLAFIIGVVPIGLALISHEHCEAH